MDRREMHHQAVHGQGSTSNTGALKVVLSN
jgi:hypothetical protein